MIHHPNRVPPPWSSDMEEALLAQNQAAQGHHRCRRWTGRLAGIVLLAIAAILGAALFSLANWPTL
jgi:hypothetical protein